MKVAGCLLFFLPFIARAAAIEHFEAAVPATCSAEPGAIATSTTHFKSGRHSLRWDWSGNGSTLTLGDPAPAAKPSAKAGIAMWAYLESPVRGRMNFDLLYQNRPVASGWFWMDFTGWRILGCGFQQIGVPAGQPVDAIRLHVPSGIRNGSVFLDMVALGIEHGASRSLQTPWVGIADGLGNPDAVALSAEDPSRNRPWLPKRPASISEDERADLQTLERAFLSPRTAPGKGLPNGKLDELRRITALYQIQRRDGTITGRPIDGGTALKPDGFIPYGEYLGTCDAVKTAYHQSREPADADELRRMFTDLTAHLLDQGWAPGLRLPAFDNYPFAQYACFYSMKDVLAEAGLARPVAQALMDSFGSHGSGDFAKEHPASTMDGLGFWNRELFACSLMFPSETEQLQHVRISKRFLDLALVEPNTIAPDGCTYHHGGFHYAYASYNMPRLLQVLEKTAQTEFRVSAEAQERLRTFVRSLAFTSSRGEQAYNLGMRAGTPLSTMGVEPVARMLANMGTADGKHKVDGEMASISLRLLAESQPDSPHPNLSKEPWKSWIGQGITPAPAPEGFLTMNGGPIAVHRRAGWLASIAGTNPIHRGIEIYGWTQTNNYGRFARNGTMVITSRGNPPGLMESGWSHDGWNWCHFPGGTAIRFPNERDIFDGYAMYGNSNANVGGTALDQDGLWCMDYSGWGLSFKKTYFCFGNRITSVTTGIRPKDAKNEHPLVTTAFQNTFKSGVDSITLDGETLGSFPFERVVSFEKNHWLIDNQRTGYLIPAGNDPLRLGATPQAWRYMIKKFLADPDQDPISGEVTYQNIRGKIKDLATIEKFYKPSEGNLALAWFDHGAGSTPASCVYTVVIRTDPPEMRRLSEAPAWKVVQSDHTAHVFHDGPSATFCYAIYQTNARLDPSTPLRACSEPCVLMIRRQGNKLRCSLCYNCLGNVVPPERNITIQLQFQGSWKTAGGDYTPEFRNDPSVTTLTIRPRDNTPLRWELQPL